MLSCQAWVPAHPERDLRLPRFSSLVPSALGAGGRCRTCVAQQCRGRGSGHHARPRGSVQISAALRGTWAAALARPFGRDAAGLAAPQHIRHAAI